MQDWLEKIHELMATLEPDIGDVTTLEDSAPWAQAVYKDLATVFAPTIRTSKKPFVLDAYSTGAAVGHKLSYLQVIGETWFPSQTIPEAPALEEIKQLLKDLENDPQEKKTAFETVQKCLGIAIAAPPAESAEFFSGFAKALKSGSINSNGGLVGASSTTLISFAILLYGKELTSRFRSVNHLHNELTAKPGHNIVGDLDRLQQLCRRWKIKFKTAGRPRNYDKAGKTRS